MLNLLIFLSAIAFCPPADSIGTEVINGKVFVIHRVDEKETLYSISRRYGTPIARILEYNPTADAGLVTGQILRIPYTPRENRNTAEGTLHRVAEKETLFSISRMYQVSVEELKQWNNLTDNNLIVGQQLIVRKPGIQQSERRPDLTPAEVRTVHTVEAGETLFSISRKYGITVQQLKEWNSLPGEDLKAGQKLFVAQPLYQPPAEQRKLPEPAALPKTDSPVYSYQSTDKKSVPVAVENPGTGREIRESGLAEWIEGTENNRKYLALHRTAPIGTILKVRNEMNNREVYVRVIGKLPDTALNDKLIIKISKSAYDRLGAIDNRFRVEVTYYQ